MKPENIPAKVKDALANEAGIHLEFKETPSRIELVITFDYYANYPEKVEAIIRTNGEDILYKGGEHATKWEKIPIFGLRLFQDAEIESWKTDILDIRPPLSARGKEQEWFILAVKILARKHYETSSTLTILQKIGYALGDYFQIPIMEQKIKALTEELETLKKHLIEKQSIQVEFSLK